MAKRYYGANTLGPLVHGYYVGTPPTYRLIDVWKFQKEQYGDVVAKKSESFSISPLLLTCPFI